MGKGKKPNFAASPEFQEDPFYAKSQQGLYDTGEALRQGKFLDASDPTVGFLNDLVKLNPEATQKAVDLASRDVERYRQISQQDILNQLEANNQLTSSTTTNRLGDLNEQFSADISDIATNFYLADVERALGNMAALFSGGVSTLDNVAARGLNNQQQVNQFAQDKHAADIALEAERYDRQNQRDISIARGLGELTGIGGMAYGAAKGNPEAARQGGRAPVELFTQIWGTIKGGGSGVQASQPTTSGNSGAGLNSSFGSGGRSSGGAYTNDQGFQLRNDALAQRRLGTSYGKGA